MTEERERPATPKATHNPYHPVVDPKEQFQTPDTTTRAPDLRSSAAGYEHPATQPRQSQPFLYGQVASTPAAPKYGNVDVSHRLNPRSPPTFVHSPAAVARQQQLPAVPAAARLGSHSTIRSAPTVGFQHPGPAAAAFWPLRPFPVYSPKAQGQAAPFRVYQPSPQLSVTHSGGTMRSPLTLGSSPPAATAMTQHSYYQPVRRRPEFPCSPLQSQSAPIPRPAAREGSPIHSAELVTSVSGRALDFDGPESQSEIQTPTLRVKPRIGTAPNAAASAAGEVAESRVVANSPAADEKQSTPVPVPPEAAPEEVKPSTRKGNTSAKRRKRRVRTRKPTDAPTADGEEDEAEDAETTAILLDNRPPKGPEKAPGHSSPEEAGTPTPANDRDADNAPELNCFRYFFTLVPLAPEQIETCEKRLSQRKKQLFFGHQTDGYHRYRSLVSRSARELDNPDHPVTPRAEYRCSKRSFDVRLAVWRRALHSWDEEQKAYAMAERNTQYRTVAEAGLEPFGGDLFPDDPQGCAAFAPSRCASTPAFRTELATPSCGGSFHPLNADPLEGSIVLNERGGPAEGRGEGLATPVVRDTPDLRSLSPVLAEY